MLSQLKCQEWEVWVEWVARERDLLKEDLQVRFKLPKLRWIQFKDLNLSDLKSHNVWRH